MSDQHREDPAVDPDGHEAPRDEPDHHDPETEEDTASGGAPQPPA